MENDRSLVELGMEAYEPAPHEAGEAVIGRK